MKRKPMLIALSVLVIAGMLVFAGCKHPRHERGAAFAVDYLSEVLDLTDTQRNDLEQIKNELLEKAGEMHADKDAVKAELMAQLRNDRLDEALLRQMVARHRADMDAIVDLGIERLVAFHQTLSPEQKAKLVDKLADCERWHRNF